ncbi:hypothetical protein [Streptomyces turgidiscabies]|uniref:Uncharacterized protein n=1 Tax=Streptomyces turgidiscabies TaxID=85558 RepID=A0ABU0RX14_9ACTN|nr:hypothetical protein [Streptomyces turgidiscabies]MDQ0935687.1 hypothetical protein [Streptomyces turgidiscabies]
MKQRTPGPVASVDEPVVPADPKSASDPDSASGGSKGELPVRDRKSGDATASSYVTEKDFAELRSARRHPYG